MSIRKTIITYLRNNKQPVYITEIMDEVGHNYQSKTDFGHQFLSQRVHEALYRLIHYDMDVKRTSRGYYQWIGK